MLRGRANELSAALGVLRRVARTGRGHVLSIVGEPGIGKSALLREIVEQARRAGYLVGVGKAEEISRIAAGAPLLTALRSGPHPLLDADAFAELGTLYADRPLWLIDRVAAMLDDLASTAPVLVAVDDLQWADELTRFALHVLPGRLAGAPVVWLTAGRPVDEPRPAGQRIDLGPLHADDLEQLAADRLGTAPTARTALLLRTVGGNPFWAARLVEAVARDGDGDLPADLILGVHRRLPVDDPDLRELLRTCAVWGRPLPAADAADLLDRPATEVLAAADRGVGQGLLQRTGAVVSFRHDLIREAVYADLTRAELAARHRACGQHLLAAGASALDAAPHFTGSAPGDVDAIRVLRAAAAEAADTLPAGAAELARRALDLVPPGPDRVAATEECAALLLRVHHGAAAIDVVDAAQPDAVTPDDRARLQVQAVLALSGMDRHAEIAPRLDPLLAEPGLSPDRRTTVAAARTLALIQLGTTQEAGAAADAALAEARAAGDPTAEGLALRTLVAVARQDGRHDLAHRRTRELRAVTGADHLADEIRCLQLLDRFDDAARLLDAVPDGAPADVDARTPDLVHAQMWQEVNLGRLDEAEAQARTLLRLADELGQHSGTVDARSVLAFVALIRGDPAEARHRLHPDGPHAPRLHDTARRLMDGWISLLVGDAAAAAELFAPLVAGAARSREYWPWFPLWTRPQVQAGLAAGHPALVTGAVELARAGADRNPGVPAFAGLALLTRGLADADPRTLDEAVDVLRGCPRPLLLASALADSGILHLAAGADQTATARLEEARRRFAELGATLPVAAIDRTLADAGIRPLPPPGRSPRPTSGWTSLTDTERLVATLVGDGHTNRTAATALGISPNTVGTHLRAVFAKLDVHSRVQLANLLNRH